MTAGDPFRWEFVNDDVFVLDTEAGVVHRLTGESADSVREARDEVSRRRAIKLSLATGVGVVTMMLPAAAAAASGGVGGAGAGGGGTGLAAPTGLTVINQGDAQVALSWNAVAGATGYLVYYREKPAGSWSAGFDNGAVTSRNVTGLVNGTTYEFKVAAKDATGTGTHSAAVEGTPVAPAAPGAPTNLAAVVSGSSVTVSWSDPASGGAVSSYSLAWRLSTDADSGGSYTTVSSGATSPMTVSNLTKGRSYVFRVTAVNGGGTASATTTSTYVPNPPSTPTGFTVAKGISNGEVVLSWDLDTVPESYTIRWKTQGSASYSPGDLATGVTGTTSTRTGLTPGTTYDFEIKAVNADGESGWASGSAAARNKPNAPTSLGAAVSGTTATVTWSAPSGGGTVDSYTVRRKVSGAADSTYVTLSSAATSPYSATGLTGGVTYIFEVSAVNADGSTAAVTSDVYVPAPPNAPGSLATAVSGTSIQVTWSAPSGGGAPTSYRVEYRLSGDADVAASYIVGSTNATSPYYISGLVPGSSYTVKVTAVNADGTASATSSSNAILDPPASPYNVTTTQGSTQLTLNWETPQSGGAVSSYTIAYGIVGAGTTTVTGISASDTSRTFTGLSNRSQYRFTITAVNADGSSPGITTYATPMYTTGFLSGDGVTSADSVEPISTLTLGDTAASLTVTSGGTNYHYQLDGATAVSVAAGSTTSIPLSAAQHTLTVRATMSTGNQAEASAVLTKRTRTHGATDELRELVVPDTVNGTRTFGLTLVGGTGGNGGNDGSRSGGATANPGQVTGTFTAAAGNRLQFVHGTGGSSGGSNKTGDGGGGGGINAVLGYRGGNGGHAGSLGSSGAGGGGGAASVVQVMSGATALKTFVAGGSGGGGGAGSNANGGDAPAGWSDATLVSGNQGEFGVAFPGDATSADGGGDGAGGGGYGGGARGGYATTTTGSPGRGGASGRNWTSSEPGLIETKGSGAGTAGTSGSVTIVYYELTTISGAPGPLVAEDALVASTPVSGTTLEPPTSVTTLIGNGQVLVSWATVTGATDYLVYARRTGGTSWLYMKTTSSLSAGIGSLVNGTSYDFVVTARAGAKLSGKSEVATATPLATADASPVAGATATLSEATVTLDWVTGCNYTYKIGAGAVTVASSDTLTAALSGSSHTVTVNKTYYDGTGVATITRTVTMTKTTTTTTSASALTYTVPAFGPREMSVDMTGGTGGVGGTDGSVAGGSPNAPGKVAGTYTVESGDTVNVYVGSGGSDGVDSTKAAAGGSGGANAYTGYDGGAGGRAGDNTFTSSGGGAGGGAASIVVRTRSGTATVLAVAAGSGGGGGAGSDGAGGAGRSHVANGSSTSGATGATQTGDGGGGGGGGGGAPGGTGGTVGASGDKPGTGGARGANSVTGLSSTTTNGTAASTSARANGSSTTIYYAVAVA